MAAAKKQKKAALPKKKTANQILDEFGIDALCGRIEGGKSQREIADSLSIDSSEITRWIAADPQRSARVREARAVSAAHWDDRAEQVLIYADEDKPGAIAKARELASHYRWRAKTRNPRDYGDAVKIDADVKVTPKMEEVDARIAQLQALIAKKS